LPHEQSEWAQRSETGLALVGQLKYEQATPSGCEELASLKNLMLPEKCWPSEVQPFERQSFW